MSAYVDLHCHWISQIDDGCRNLKESTELLQGLKRLGFQHVVATPHMRPGMFDNRSVDLRERYLSILQELKDSSQAEGLPQTSLSSEHFFDASVVEAIVDGLGLPYAKDEDVASCTIRKKGSLLIEFHDLTPLPVIEKQLFRLQTQGFTPVVAHPERYRAVWEKPELVDHLQDLGCVALLDAAALVGKYGQNSKSCALRLLEQGSYHAACSDAHRPSDVSLLSDAMHYIEREYGQEELTLLFAEGPLSLLEGRRPSSLS